MRFRTILYLLILLGLSPLQSFAQMPQLSSQQQYMLSEIRDSYGGLYNMSSNYPRAYNIYRQLVVYSGMNYYVTFAQTFNWGQAHAGGLIILDYSTINKRQEILAFVFAHEWGHQALGHQPNMYFPYGNRSPEFRTLPSANEDAADAYAGRFLARYGYDITSVTSYLRSLPESDDHTHSTGEKRADILETAYTGTGSRNRGYEQVRTRERCSTCDATGYEEEEVTCRYCRGNGVVYCSTCKGQGSYVAAGYNMYNQYGYWRYTCQTCGGGRQLTCAGCKGTGNVTRKIRCTDCSGSGYENE